MDINSYIEYQQSFKDEIEIAQFITNATKVNSLTDLKDNTYFYSNMHEVHFKSDGTKRVGITFEVQGNVLREDFVTLVSDLRYFNGDIPTIIYEEYEGSDSTVLEKIYMKKLSGFEKIELQKMATNRYGTYKGRVFIGLEKGQSGTFSLRHPLMRHLTRLAYSNTQIKREFKMFQLTKANGNWTVDNTTSYRLLDEATITFGATTMFINFKTPFIQDVPQVFITENNIFGGHTIKFGYRAKNQVELHLFDATGKNVKWDTLADGAVFNIKLEAGLYY